MQRRDFLGAALVGGAALAPAGSWAQDPWGETSGYPTGWGPAGAQQKWEGYPQYHVGNFSGGLETMFAHRVIRASQSPLPLTTARRKIKLSMFMDASDYAHKFNRTGLLIARGDEIWHEQYRFKRTADMRFFGWSMTKSIVGLLVGIALEQQRLLSLDDRLDKYLAQLQGHPFAPITLRQLLNMSSGIHICESFCSPNNGFERYGYSQIGYSPRRAQGTDQIQALLNFRWGLSDPPGQRFNYTDICPVLIGWVLETVYQQPLHAIAEQLLWQPLGAQSDASWLTDAAGFTFSGAGFSATLRDWARLALLVAGGGASSGRQVVPLSWIDETCRHTEKDQVARFNVVRPGRGYRNFFWHQSADGQLLRMAGNHAQNVLIDRKTKTVLVQTGVGSENGADEQMLALFASACSA
jgi:CubicO group peptidase (beta-lactamase class C family)